MAQVSGAAFVVPWLPAPASEPLNLPTVEAFSRSRWNTFRGSGSAGAAVGVALWMIPALAVAHWRRAATAGGCRRGQRCRKEQRTQRAQAVEDKSSPAGHRQSYKSLFTEEGRAELELSHFLPVPVVPAGTTNGKASWSAEAPCAHRDGYADLSSRGTKFSLLPPPAKQRDHAARDGAGQLCMKSRADMTTDIRLKDRPGDARTSAIRPDPKAVEASSVCLVPEPYYRAARPDQRVRAPTVAGAFEPWHVTFQREKVYFQTPVERKDQWGDTAALRQRLCDRARPVSGDRKRLVEQVKIGQLDRSSNEWRELCSRKGIHGTPAQMEEALSAAYGFESLSLKDLQFECAYRNQDTRGTRAELIGRLPRITRRWR